MPAKLIQPGTIYSRLTAIEAALPIQYPDGVNHSRTQFQCSCGKIVICENAQVRMGVVRSCGCLAIESARKLLYKHGLSRSRIYHVWHGMCDRCSPTNRRKQYRKNYAGRGITVCDRWKTFENFLSDMGPGKLGWSLDRLNNNEGYNLYNCVWATAIRQSRNRRNNTIITIDGITGCVAELCDHFGVPRQRVYKRLKTGWTPEEAIKVPPLICTVDPIGKTSSFLGISNIFII